MATPQPVLLDLNNPVFQEQLFGLEVDDIVLLFAAFRKLKKLDWPTLFCNALEVDASGRIAGYQLRIPDGKRRAVEALRAIHFRIVAAGDSYNDTTMLGTADAGILFRPPANVVADFPQFPVTTTYDELRAAFTRAGVPA